MNYFVYLGFLYSVLLVGLVYRAKKLDVVVTDALDFALIIMVLGLVGGRLTHVLWESPEVYKNDWARVMYIWEGGFVFYGGAILAFCGCLLFAYFRKLNLPLWADFFAPLAAVGYALGRISCFIAGCCYGRSCDLPWAVDGRHPTQLYAVGAELITVTVLIFLEQRKSLKSGMLFLWWVFLHSGGRLIMEYFRDDARGPLLSGLSISTWISLALLSLSAALLGRAKTR